MTPADGCGMAIVNLRQINLVKVQYCSAERCCGYAAMGVTLGESVMTPAHIALIFLKAKYPLRIMLLLNIIAGYPQDCPR